MKIVALEEHMVTPGVMEAWASAPDALDYWTKQLREGQIGERLVEMGDGRLRDMDDIGVDVQVLSLTVPGLLDVAAADATSLARESNDAVAEAVRANPDRFEGFATLPTQDPESSVEELRRAIETLGLKGVLLNGRTGERNIDHPDFEGIYETAAELGAPIYIHPQIPVGPVRQAYYSGFGEKFDTILATYGVGWHYETGMQLLRLIYSGTFDRHPDLQVIVGHWGEMILFFQERIAVLDGMGLNLDRSLSDYLKENVYYTGSGVMSQRYLRWTLEIVGAERVMYATDYPFIYAGDGAGRAFLEKSDLSSEDKERIAHGNWEQLTSRQSRSSTRETGDSRA